MKDDDAEVEAILALPHDDSALREVCMRVAREAGKSEEGELTSIEYAQDIVDRILEGK
jgi:hypothetical protein